MSIEKQKSVAADVLGLGATDSSSAGFERALETLGYDLDILTVLSASPDKDLGFEAKTDFETLRALFFGGGGHSSTLTDWHAYQYMARHCGRKSSTGGIALLIGSQSALSSRSFVRMAEEEYGVDRTCVVDLFATKPKAGHGDFFARASGLNLPFATGSVDVVHTNRLLHMLEDPSSPGGDPLALIPRFAQEVTRVLAPQGQLFMYENAPPVDGSLQSTEEKKLYALTIGAFVAGQLTDAGMETAHIIPGFPAIAPIDLLDRARTFDNSLDSRRTESDFGIYGIAKQG